MKLSRCLFSVVLLLGLAGTLWAQAAPAPAPTAMTKTVVIHAGHLLDVKTGKTLANQTILIQGDKIASVGSDAQVPAGAQVIDLPNATVLPGLIDAHTHLTMMYREDYARAMLDRLQKPIPEMALDASVNTRVTLM